ncbi:hypothetical protein ES332_D13G229600v1 [Gossypium tomentosum]|uniref:Uncharacterized protein n=1 Tax=Gossypium tomentosum TaxID=34277 RepID=A0A5D2I0E6_GOSTO|nr:hypothetical protein ES332_D13G229600v1 [Gossypium tomentosum]
MAKHGIGGFYEYFTISQFNLDMTTIISQILVVVCSTFPKCFLLCLQSSRCNGVRSSACGSFLTLLLEILFSSPYRGSLF